jgi:hypothetical protein
MDVTECLFHTFSLRIDIKSLCENDFMPHCDSNDEVLTSSTFICCLRCNNCWGLWRNEQRIKRHHIFLLFVIWNVFHLTIDLVKRVCRFAYLGNYTVGLIVTQVDVRRGWSVSMVMVNFFYPVCIQLRNNQLYCLMILSQVSHGRIDSFFCSKLCCKGCWTLEFPLTSRLLVSVFSHERLTENQPNFMRNLLRSDFPVLKRWHSLYFHFVRLWLQYFRVIRQ